MRSFAFLLALSGLFLAGSAPAQDGEPLDSAVARARAEQAAAEGQAARLERAASKAHDKAERLRAEQAAASQAIQAAEARITAADAQVRLLSASLEARRQRLLGLVSQRNDAYILEAGESVLKHAWVREVLSMTDGAGKTAETVSATSSPRALPGGLPPRR